MGCKMNSYTPWCTTASPCKKRLKLCSMGGGAGGSTVLLVTLKNIEIKCCHVSLLRIDKRIKKYLKLSVEKNSCSIWCVAEMRGRCRAGIWFALSTLILLQLHLD